MQQANTMISLLQLLDVGLEPYGLKLYHRKSCWRKFRFRKRKRKGKIKVCDLNNGYCQKNQKRKSNRFRKILLSKVLQKRNISFHMHD